MNEIIKVTNLTKQFKQITAVNNLSFNVNSGDVYGFLGQNGAGKSTTIRMLLTLIQPTNGSIEIFGLPLQNNRNEILKNIGAVIEKPDVYKYLSAYDNLKLFARLNGTRPTHHQLMQQLEIVGLANRAKDKVATFSQGMKQRVGIAIALIHQPQLIILDEPTNGLDPQGIADIRNLIIKLSKEHGKTILISSHLLSEIEQIATRILIIDKGKKIIEDTATALFNPSQTIVEIETTNNEFALQQLQKSKWLTSIQQHTTNTITFKLDKSQIPTLNSNLVEMQIQLISIKPRHSLEDY
ncbi:MAG TPA: ABC transporter ATP-binding protein, partial [Chitinophagaceae bacterium]|nr:ABC transporter ATP-binding protein [Chitinophagaceae bacterium]